MRIKALFATVSLGMALVASGASAQNYWTNGTPHYWPGNGHYYQGWAVSGYPPWYSYSDVEEFVSTLSYNGLPAHLLTCGSYDEYLNVGWSEKGLVGAYGNNTATGYTWLDGTPVEMYAPFYPCIRTSCQPLDRLAINTGRYDGVPSVVACQWNNEMGFTVEYEAGSVAVDSQSWGRIKALCK